jgi:hypothetical protein
MLYINARIVIFIIILLLIDLYAYQAFRFTASGSSKKIVLRVKTVYWIISCFCFAIIALTQFTDWHSWNKYLRTYGLALLIITFLPKFILATFVLLDDLVRILHWILIKFSSWFKKPEEKEYIPQTKTLSRSDFIIKTGLVVASIPFISLTYGMAFNAYNYKIRRTKLILPDLPDSFDGFKIVQVSDIHTGSFLSTDPLEHAVNIINEQKADVVFFTGDLVNNNHSEALNYIDVLKKI